MNKLLNKTFSGRNKGVYARRSIFALFVVATVLLQYSKSISLFNYKGAMPVVVLVSVIALFERSTVGMFFGVFAGLLCDVGAVQGDGYFAIVLCVLGFCCGLLSSLIFRSNLVSALILSAVSVFVSMGLYFLCFVLFKDFSGSIGVLLSRVLPAFLYTMIFVPIFYFPIRAIYNEFSPEKAFTVRL